MCRFLQFSTFSAHSVFYRIVPKYYKMHSLYADFCNFQHLGMCLVHFRYMPKCLCSNQFILVSEREQSSDTETSGFICLKKNQIVLCHGEDLKLKVGNLPPPHAHAHTHDPGPRIEPRSSRTAPARSDGCRKFLVK